VLTYLAQDWDTFDTWCLVRGIDADTLTSRRLVHLAFTQLTEGVDPERSTAFISELERIGNNLLDPVVAREGPIPDSVPPPGW
jgi:hypothetical protein